MPFYGLCKPQEGQKQTSKLQIFMVLNPVHLLGKLFWVDRGGSLPLKPISIMDLGHCIQMNPLNTFLWPLAASRRPKIGLKIANFHGFEPHTPSGRLFWVDHGSSLPVNPISIMDLGYYVQMNP